MRPLLRAVTVAVVTISSLGMVTAASAGGFGGPDEADPFAYWTPERVASAAPRDLVIDHRGLGYLRRADGTLAPYGHSVAAEARPLTATQVAGAMPVPRDSAAPSPTSVTFPSMTPGDGATIGGSATFEIHVDSTNGVRQVTAYVGPTGGAVQSFRMSYVGTSAGAEIWRANLQGFSDGIWNWHANVRDGGPKGGTRVDSPPASFIVDTGSGSGGGGGGGTVVNERWTNAGQVQASAGRILFTMPDGNYVCSGTAMTDGTSGRSIIITAAHCIYDDVNKVFASQAIFIPNQDDGGTDGTDWTCANDPFGCWSVDHGVVDVNWTIREFPDNIPWDYGYYVVSDTGAHSGTSAPDALDAATGTLDVSFDPPTTGQSATALGYSYADDPNFMYCQEPMGTNGSANYWLDSCGLSGGSSGGPWMQPFGSGDGTLVSVNSWGYTTRAGMAGPKLHDNSAADLFGVSTCSELGTSGSGVVVDPAAPPCSPSSATTTTTTTTATTAVTTTTTTTTTTVAPDSIRVTVSAYKQRGIKIGELSWEGATGGSVEITRDGSPLAGGPFLGVDGTHTDNTGQKGGGTTTWQVCETGTGNCASYVHTW